MLPATSSDVVSAYRLFLGREPDIEGFRHFQHLISSGQFPAIELAQLFSRSPEALAVAAARAMKSETVEVIDLESFRLETLPAWNAVNAEIASTKTYEPHVTRHFKEAIKPGMVFADIGANIGYYSMLAASHGARVHAFEPGPRNVWLLNRSAKLNGFHIDIYPYALAETERLVVYSPLDGNGQISDLGDSLPSPDQEVLRTRTLDSVLHDLPDIIKIDVEGAEAVVAKGATRALDARPIVFSEFSASGIESVSKISANDYLSTFTSRGYTLAICHHDGELTAHSAEDIERASRESITGFIDIIARPDLMVAPQK